MRVLGPGIFDTFPYAIRHTRRSRRLAYCDVGSGPTVLLLHGLGSNLTHWEHVAPSLIENHRVVAFDLPGCGHSDKPHARYSLDGYVDATIELMDELGIKEATMVGHSLGGMVAVAAALRSPWRVQRLGIINGAGFHRYALPLRIAAQAVHPKLISTFMLRMGPALLDHVFAQKNRFTEHFLAQTQDRPEQPTVDNFARMASSLLPELARRHFLDELDRIVQPTLVLWGDQDRLLPIKTVPHWVARIPRARLVVFRNCGHMPIIEQPAAVTRELTSFLASDASHAMQIR